MSTPFYDLASLVVVPSGYKSGKVYAQKPLTTDGQLTFTRASNATRVGPNGLIEEVRTNILLESNGFSTVSWVKSGTGTGLAPVVTANAGTAPDGTNTASRVQFNCVGSTIADRSILNQSRTSTSSTPYVSSVFVKAFSAGEVGKQLRFITELAGTQVIVTLTANWQRVLNLGTASGTSANFVIETRGTVTTNASADVLLAFAQLETGDIATAYIPTTTAAVSVGPVSGLPRLDYLNSTCPRLILEGQRTNLVTFSEQFDNAIWSKTNTTITANTAVSPDGYTNADKLVENTSLGNHRIFQGPAATPSTAYTASVFVKKEEITSVEILETTLGGCIFNLTNGTITSGTGGFIENYGNGWFRCGITKTTGVAQVGFTLQIRLVKGGTSTYTGNGVDGLYLWGCQIEAGAYATSYIPTLAASVTRVADAASKTGISSLIGQTEGTLFAEVDLTNFDTSNVRIFAISDGTSSNRVNLLTNSSNRITFTVSASGAGQAEISTISLNKGVHKIAAGYSANNFVLYVDGLLIGTDTSGSVPICSNVYIGKIETSSSTGILGDRISQALLFKTRLTNAQLAELTAL